MIYAVIDTNVLVAAAKQHRPGHKLRTDNAEGKRAITVLHVDGIIDFIQQRANEPLLFHPALSHRLDTKNCRGFL